MESTKKQAYQKQYIKTWMRLSSIQPLIVSCRKFTMRNQIESKIQSAIVNYVRNVVKDCLVIAIPNGSRRTSGGWAANAVSGLTPGAPDLVIALPEGRVFWLEVKAPKGRLSDNQVLIHEKMNELGHAIYVVRSIEEVRCIMDNLNIKTRETK